MRKNIIIMVIAMFALQVPTQAQTYDTLRGPNGKLPGYHYTHWFDSCDAWNDTTEFGWLYINHWIGGYCNLWSIETHVELPALIKGFGVMAETMETNRELLESQHGRDTGPRMPEYVYMWMGCRHREERDPPLLIRHATTLPNSTHLCGRRGHISIRRHMLEQCWTKYWWKHWLGKPYSDSLPGDS